MILQTLLNTPLPNSSTEIMPLGYTSSVIAWEIALDDSGELLVVNRHKTKTRKDQKLLFVPDIDRSSDVNPILLCDKVPYVFAFEAYEKSNPKEKKSDLKYRAFIALMEDCYAKTNIPQIYAIVQFLQRDAILSLASDYDFEEEDRVLFTVNGEHLQSRSEIQEYWLNKRWGRSGNTAEDTFVTCLICGQKTSAVPDKYVFHVSATPNSGEVGFITYNLEESASSHGLEKGRNAPICYDCSEKLRQRYKTLQKSGYQFSIDSTSAFMVLGTEAEQAVDIFDAIKNPENETVKHIFQMNHKIANTVQYVKTNRSFSLLFTGEADTGRGWYYGREYQFDAVVQNVADWFAKQRMIGMKEDKYYEILELVRSLYSPKVKDKNIPTAIQKTIHESVLSGTPLPTSILILAITRNRREQAITHERAILMNYILTQRGDANRLSLDVNENNPGYVLGRLLAHIDYAQYSALGQVGITVSNRYYGGASTTPALVFTKLMPMYFVYVQKMKQLGKIGLATNVEKITAQILDLLGTSFPSQFGLEDQARFALGYYHERQNKFGSKGQNSNNAEESTYVAQ